MEAAFNENIPSRVSQKFLLQFPKSEWLNWVL